ncbi:MAG: PKD domain-containing protein [Bacteroides sp.]|nr:PKD domain-containing protein [Bacteroides sp.]
MDWAKDVRGNRNPVVIINNQPGIEIIHLTPQAGESITLDASWTYDPDGDPFSFQWWIVSEAGSYPGEMALENPENSSIELNIPPDAAGKSIHIVCEVTDKGIPNLTGYRRIIIEPVP